MRDPTTEQAPSRGGDGSSRGSDGSSRGVARGVVDRIRHDDVPGLSAEIAYRFLFAVFPFGLFVAALAAFVAGLLGIANPAAQIVAGLHDNLPPGVADALQPELQRLMSSPRADLLSIGAVLALVAATGGTNALVKGLHRAYEIPESRSFVVRYAVAVGLTVLAAIGIVAAFTTIVGGALVTTQVAQQIGLGPDAWAALQMLRWPVVFVGLVLAVAILYRYAPNVVVPWRWILLGSVVFTVGWLIASAALGFYATRVADFGATYGSLSGVIVLMLWFYVTAALLVIGGEVTALFAKRRAPLEIHRRHEEDRAAAAVEAAADGAHRRLDGATGQPRDRLSRPRP